MKKFTNRFPSSLFVVFSIVIINACQSKDIQKETIAKSDSSSQTIPPPVEDISGKTLSEKILLDYVVSAKSVKPNSKNGIPFNQLDYDKVIAYDFEGSEEPYAAVIDRNEKFVPVVLAQQYLTQEQADKILSGLASESTYGETTAACFQPHFALVLFKNGKKVNQINVCLDCNYQISDLEIPAETFHKINEGKEDEFPLTGYTNKGKKAIIDLCKELNFTYGKKVID